MNKAVKTRSRRSGEKHIDEKHIVGELSTASVTETNWPESLTALDIHGAERRSGAVPDLAHEDGSTVTDR